MGRKFNEKEENIIWGWIQMTEVKKKVEVVYVDSVLLVRDDDFEGWFSNNVTSAFSDIEQSLKKALEIVKKRLKRKETDVFNIFNAVVSKDERLNKDKNGIDTLTKELIERISLKHERIYDLSYEASLDKFINEFDQEVKNLAYKVEQKRKRQIEKEKKKAEKEENK